MEEANRGPCYAALEGRALSWCSAFITRCCAFWGESVIKRRRHKGREKELEFGRTYHSSAFILSGHRGASIQTNTVTIH